LIFQTREEELMIKEMGCGVAPTSTYPKLTFKVDSYSWKHSCQLLGTKEDEIFVLNEEASLRGINWPI
jgi:hypothetical protein